MQASLQVPAAVQEMLAEWNLPILASKSGREMQEVRKEGEEGRLIKMPGEEFFAQSKTAEHYTPRFWWEKVITVLGEIDVDPCSDPHMAIPAKVHFTKEHDGLRQAWHGKTYMNPVYGKELAKWIRKLDLEIREGRCTEAIVLWKAALETEHSRIITRNPLYKISAVPRARISFLCGDSDQKKQGDKDSPTFTPIFHYLGNNPEKFVAVFGKHADIWKYIPTEQSESLDNWMGQK